MTQRSMTRSPHLEIEPESGSSNVNVNVNVNVTTSINCNVSPDLLKAGKCIFTISNDNKRKHYTFRCRRKKCADGKVRYFLYLLTGNEVNNTASYTYCGILQLQPHLQLMMTQKSKLTTNSIAHRVLNFALRIIEGRQRLPEGYSLHHSMNCAKCGRTLTTPQSIELGVGPECAKVVGDYYRGGR